MVRQWQELFFDNRLSGVDLEGNPDFVKLAGAYGIKGWRISAPADVDAVLKAAMDYNDGPCVVEAEVDEGGQRLPDDPGRRGAARHDHRAAEAQDGEARQGAPKSCRRPQRRIAARRLRSRSAPVHTISILVRNKPGVLVRVALVFSRRGYNIESLVVSPTSRTASSRA